MSRYEDDEQFRLFVQRQWEPLLRTAYLLTGDRGTAEDLAQSALEKTHRRWGRVLRRDAPEVYVRRAMVNTAISWRRRRRPLEPAGGGVIAYALHGDDRTGWSTDLRLLLPAEGADQRPVGWRIRADNGVRTPTDRVRVIAPPGAARVTVTVDGEPPATVTLDASNAGTTRIPPDQPATLTAYSPDGSILGTAPLPPVEANMSGLPGDSPATRVTP
ncbi:hypothetical protein EAD89_09755 [Micromonospora sp. BL4]|uniref:sigma factor n=1 Tax=Micromonospora sp. BL4 TaxID=2478710 RepID=UPI000EF55E5C|nr:sigma factor [Micromonospora sp. BL4]RLP91999.1 hypothetical protein EAD89_09755 [Micromonospora sp. BL4]